MSTPQQDELSTAKPSQKSAFVLTGNKRSREFPDTAKKHSQFGNESPDPEENTLGFPNHNHEDSPIIAMEEQLDEGQIQHEPSKLKEVTRSEQVFMTNKSVQNVAENIDDIIRGSLGQTSSAGPKEQFAAALTLENQVTLEVPQQQQDVGSVDNVQQKKVQFDIHLREINQRMATQGSQNKDIANHLDMAPLSGHMFDSNPDYRGVGSAEATDSLIHISRGIQQPPPNMFNWAMAGKAAESTEFSQKPESTTGQFPQATPNQETFNSNQPTPRTKEILRVIGTGQSNGAFQSPRFSPSHFAKEGQFMTLPVSNYLYNLQPFKAPKKIQKLNPAYHKLLEMQNIKRSQVPAPLTQVLTTQVKQRFNTPFVQIRNQILEQAEQMAHEIPGTAERIQSIAENLNIKQAQQFQRERRSSSKMDKAKNNQSKLSQDMDKSGEVIRQEMPHRFPARFSHSISSHSHNQQATNRDHSNSYSINTTDRKAFNKLQPNAMFPGGSFHIEGQWSKNSNFQNSVSGRNSHNISKTLPKPSYKTGQGPSPQQNLESGVLPPGRKSDMGAPVPPIPDIKEAKVSTAPSPIYLNMPSARDKEPKHEEFQCINPTVGPVPIKKRPSPRNGPRQKAKKKPGEKKSHNLNIVLTSAPKKRQSIESQDLKSNFEKSTIILGGSIPQSNISPINAAGLLSDRNSVEDSVNIGVEFASKVAQIPQVPKLHLKAISAERKRNLEDKLRLDSFRLKLTKLDSGQPGQVTQLPQQQSTTSPIININSPARPVITQQPTEEGAVGEKHNVESFIVNAEEFINVPSSVINGTGGHTSQLSDRNQDALKKQETTQNSQQVFKQVNSQMNNHPVDYRASSSQAFTTEPNAQQAPYHESVDHSLVDRSLLHNQQIIIYAANATGGGTTSSKSPKSRSRSPKAKMKIGLEQPLQVVNSHQDSGNLKPPQDFNANSSGSMVSKTTFKPESNSYYLKGHSAAHGFEQSSGTSIVRPGYSKMMAQIENNHGLISNAGSSMATQQPEQPVITTEHSKLPPSGQQQPTQTSPRPQYAQQWNQNNAFLKDRKRIIQQSIQKQKEILQKSTNSHIIGQTFQGYQQSKDRMQTITGESSRLMVGALNKGQSSRESVISKNRFKTLDPLAVRSSDINVSDQQSPTLRQTSHLVENLNKNFQEMDLPSREASKQSILNIPNVMVSDYYQNISKGIKETDHEQSRAVSGTASPDSPLPQHMTSKIGRRSNQRVQTDREKKEPGLDANQNLILKIMEIKQKELNQSVNSGITLDKDSSVLPSPKVEEETSPSIVFGALKPQTFPIDPEYKELSATTGSLSVVTRERKTKTPVRSKQVKGSKIKAPQVRQIKAKIPTAQPKTQFSKFRNRRDSPASSFSIKKSNNSPKFGATLDYTNLEKNPALQVDSPTMSSQLAAFQSPKSQTGKMGLDLNLEMLSGQKLTDQQKKTSPQQQQEPVKLSEYKWPVRGGQPNQYIEALERLNSSVEQFQNEQMLSAVQQIEKSDLSIQQKSDLVNDLIRQIQDYQQISQRLFPGFNDLQDQLKDVKDYEEPSQPNRQKFNLHFTTPMAVRNARALKTQTHTRQKMQKAGSQADNHLRVKSSIGHTRELSLEQKQVTEEKPQVTQQTFSQTNEYLQAFHNDDLLESEYLSKGIIGDHKQTPNPLTRILDESSHLNDPSIHKLESVPHPHEDDLSSVQSNMAPSPGQNVKKLIKRIVDQQNKPARTQLPLKTQTPIIANIFNRKQFRTNNPPNLKLPKLQTEELEKLKNSIQDNSNNLKQLQMLTQSLLDPKADANLYHVQILPVVDKPDRAPSFSNLRGGRKSSPFTNEIIQQFPNGQQLPKNKMLSLNLADQNMKTWSQSKHRLAQIKGSSIQRGRTPVLAPNSQFFNRQRATPLTQAPDDPSISAHGSFRLRGKEVIPQGSQLPPQSLGPFKAKRKSMLTPRANLMPETCSVKIQHKNPNQEASTIIIDGKAQVVPRHRRGVEEPSTTELKSIPLQLLSSNQRAVANFGKELQTLGSFLKQTRSNQQTSNTQNSQESLTQRFIRQAQNLLGNAEQKLEQSLRENIPLELGANLKSFSQDPNDVEAIVILGDKGANLDNINADLSKSFASGAGREMLLKHVDSDQIKNQGRGGGKKNQSPRQVSMALNEGKSLLTDLAAQITDGKQTEAGKSIHLKTSKKEGRTDTNNDEVLPQFRIEANENSQYKQSELQSFQYTRKSPNREISSSNSRAELPRKIAEVNIGVNEVEIDATTSPHQFIGKRGSRSNEKEDSRPSADNRLSAENSMRATLPRSPRKSLPRVPHLMKNLPKPLKISKITPSLTINAVPPIEENESPASRSVLQNRRVSTIMSRLSQNQSNSPYSRQQPDTLQTHYWDTSQYTTSNRANHAKKRSSSVLESSLKHPNAVESNQTQELRASHAAEDHKSLLNSTDIDQTASAHPNQSQISQYEQKPLTLTQPEQHPTEDELIAKEQLIVTPPEQVQARLEVNKPKVPKLHLDEICAPSPAIEMAHLGSVDSPGDRMDTKPEFQSSRQETMSHQSKPKIKAFIKHSPFNIEEGITPRQQRSAFDSKLQTTLQSFRASSQTPNYNMVPATYSIFEFERKVAHPAMNQGSIFKKCIDKNSMKKHQTFWQQKTTSATPTSQRRKLRPEGTKLNGVAFPQSQLQIEPAINTPQQVQMSKDIISQINSSLKNEDLDKAIKLNRRLATNQKLGYMPTPNSRAEPSPRNIEGFILVDGQKIVQKTKREDLLKLNQQHHIETTITHDQQTSDRVTPIDISMSRLGKKESKDGRVISTKVSFKGLEHQSSLAQNSGQGTSRNQNAPQSFCMAPERTSPRDGAQIRKQIHIKSKSGIDDHAVGYFSSINSAGKPETSDSHITQRNQITNEKGASEAKQPKMEHYADLTHTEESKLSSAPDHVYSKKQQQPSADYSFQHRHEDDNLTAGSRKLGMDLVATLEEETAEHASRVNTKEKTMRSRTGTQSRERSTFIH